MATVIVGAGIVGVSTAYYLSQSDTPTSDKIHLIEASPELFASASGFAAGFLAADWFAPPLSKLGKLSFDLHKQLAEQHNGYDAWGYSQSTGISLAETISERNGSTGDDWLMEGVSRAVAAENTQPSIGHAPKWLQGKGRLDVLSSGDTTAQMYVFSATCQAILTLPCSNPRRLCEFLLSFSLSKGVYLHQPARPIAISRASDGSLSSITVANTQSNTEYTLPCAKLVITAGAWSPQVFSALFPTSKIKLPITSLAGHSLLVRSPHWPPLDETDPANDKQSRQNCHAVFTTEAEGAYSPELFSRMPQGEVYLAGLNSSTYPLPKLANERKIDPAAIATLKRTTKRLLGDVEVVRESVCWRPITSKGVPIVCNLGAKGEKGVFVAAGHGAWGITMSLGTGYCVAGMSEGRGDREYVAELGL